MGFVVWAGDGLEWGSLDIGGRVRGMGMEQMGLEYFLLLREACGGLVGHWV